MEGSLLLNEPPALLQGCSLWLVSAHHSTVRLDTMLLMLAVGGANPEKWDNIILDIFL